MILGLVAVQAFLHLRHVAFLAILFGYWMPQHIQSAFNGWRESRARRRDSAPLSQRAAVLLGVEFAAVVALLGGMLVYELANFGVDREDYPVSAIQFMSDNQLQGRVVVTFNWAQYTLAALYPESTVGFDGRFRRRGPAAPAAARSPPAPGATCPRRE